MKRLILLSLLLFSLAACGAKPPYKQAGATNPADLAADYQDCYSLGCLEHFTPGATLTVNQATSRCMQARNYQPTCMAW